MLELTYSNRTEALLQRLAERVRIQREADPFEPLHLVVPNPHLKEYLRVGLASELGIAANLKFSYLAGLWRDLLPLQAPRILDSDRLRAALLGVLDDAAFLGGEGLEPVRAYLGGDGASMKRVQLAGELARVLEEYQLSRADWIDAWREGRSAGTADGAMEAWQSRLWREAVRRLDAAGAGEHLTLLEQVRRSRLEGLGLPRAIHAFALSHVAQAYQEVYRAFAGLEGTTLHLYALNPCEEFWEDLATDRRTLFADRPHRDEARQGPWDGASEDFYQLEGQGPRALRFWGRPGRENIRLLNEVSDCDFTSAFEAPLAPTLLGQIQRDLLLFQDPPEGPGAEPDASVRCLAAPSPRREAEMVASAIWDLLEAQGDRSPNPLRLSDIAVAVPPGEQEAYRAHLEAAFQDAHRLPLVQSDRALPVMRQTLEAVKALLDLPASGLTRAALLQVLQHPALQRRFPDLDTEAWARWCEALGIVRGADRQDWEGTYLDQDALNWDQGLRRLTLGAFMAEDSEFEDGGERYQVPGPQEERSAAVFTALVRGLAAESREIQRARATPRDWMARLGEHLERWLQVDEGEEAEAVLKALERIRTFLGRAFEGLPAGLGLPLLDFPAARHLALEALARLDSEQPANLAKGVIIGTYASLRAIPFRALFLMGLGEGSFPTRNRRSALDLRSQERRPGDVSQTEKEKYLFLELLLSARDHLCLSHVALDELSGEPLEPSGLFKEFRALLGDYLGPGWAPGPADPLLARHPLRRFDPAYFPLWFPEAEGEGLGTHSEAAQAEARALWMGQRARACGIPTAQALGELPLPAGTLDRLRTALGTLAAPEAPAGERPLIRITLQDLKTFLECPLSGAAAVRLGLRKLSLEDRSAVRDEAFESGFLEAWSLQREVALGCLRDGTDPEAAYDQGLRRLQAQGLAPFGIFSEVEKRALLQPIQAWVDHLRGPGGGRPGTWRLGTSPFRNAPVDHPLPPLELTVPVAGLPRRVELAGELRPQLGGSLFLEEGQPPSASDRAGIHRKALGAYLDHLILACVDPGHGAHPARFVFSASVTRRGSKEPTREILLPFPALTPEQARAQLEAWIGDLLAGDHGVLMPIEAVLRHAPEGTLTPEAILAYVEEQTEKQERASFSTLHGPVPDPLRFPPPAEPMALARRRLGGFLDALAASEEKD